MPPPTPLSPTPLQSTLPPPTLARLASDWLREDTPSFDPAAAALSPACVTATLFAKSDLLLAGAPFFDAVFRQCDCAVAWHHADGHFVHVAPGARLPLARVSGRAADLLRGERVALNALAECCGVATAARRAVECRRRATWRGALAATRKTAPGLRLLQKYAVLVAGMDAHRMDLSAMVMLKDNHIAAAGSIAAAVDAALSVAGFALKIDVECATVDDALHACRAGADVVMLDNFDAAHIPNAVNTIKAQWPRVLVEVSGGVTLESLPTYMIEGVDVVSFSVNKYREPVDLSLKLDPS